MNFQKGIQFEDTNPPFRPTEPDWPTFPKNLGTVFLLDSSTSSCTLKMEIEIIIPHPIDLKRYIMDCFFSELHEEIWRMVAFFLPTFCILNAQASASRQMMLKVLRSGGKKTQALHHHNHHQHGLFLRGVTTFRYQLRRTLWSGWVYPHLVSHQFGSIFKALKLFRFSLVSKRRKGTYHPARTPR